MSHNPEISIFDPSMSDLIPTTKCAPPPKVAFAKKKN